MEKATTYKKFPLLFILYVILMGGCTFTHTLHPEVSFDTLPEVEKIFVTTGVYYSPQFKSYSHTRIFGPHKYVVPIGSDSVAIFNKVLPLVFDKVVPVSSTPPYRANAPNVDLVLEPAIEHFNFMLGLDSLSEDKSIVYRFILYNLDGSPIESWSIRGQPENESSWSTPAGYIDNDVEDAIIKFMKKFSANESTRTAIMQAVGKKQGAETSPSQSLPQVVVKATPVREHVQVGDETRDLNDFGVVVLSVTIENLSDRSVSADASTFRLELSEGNKFVPSDVTSLFTRLEKRSYSGDVTSALLGPVFGLAVTVAEDAQKESRQRNLREQVDPRLLNPAVSLAPGQSTSGLLLFVPPDETGSFSRARLTIWIKDQDRQQQQRVIELDNINYKSIKSAPSR